MQNYFIKEGYRSNLDPGRVRKYDAAPSDQYQENVYQYAADLVREHALHSVVDCGCGSGYKLAKYIGPVCSDITGLDQDAVIRHCLSQYPRFTWLPANFEERRVEVTRKYDLILCVDVIEHLIDPDALLSILKFLAHPESHIVLSTPERDLIHGLGHLGAPANPYHVREWNMGEFRSYLEASGFTVTGHILVDATTQLDWKSRLKRVVWPKRYKTCQVAVCRVLDSSPIDTDRRNDLSKRGQTRCAAPV